MKITRKQRYVLNIINKINKPSFSPKDIFNGQGRSKLFTNKVITNHLINLEKNGKLTRLCKGHYMLTATIQNKMKAKDIQPLQILPKAKTTEAKPISTKTSNTLDMPQFLSNEDIQKLLDWKEQSIQNTNEDIQKLNLKLTKLKKQISILNDLKDHFC